jgi:hypothetical protein
MKGSYHFDTVFPDLNPLKTPNNFASAMLLRLDSFAKASEQSPFEENSFHLIRAQRKISAMPLTEKKSLQEALSVA